MTVTRCLIVVAVVLWGHSATARNDFRYSGFSDNVSEFHRLTLAYCQRHAAAVLNTAGIFGRLNEPDNLRRACGQGLDGTEIAYTPWRHWYWRSAGPDSALDVLGIVRHLSHEGRVYSLLVGLETRISRPHNKPEERQALAVATLFEQQGESWAPAWQFVNPATQTFHRPDGGGFFDDVWRQHVTFGFGKLLHSLKDARGPGFPN